MSNKIWTVTIGIPAYNEAANIKHLLQEILSQRKEDFTLEKIIVVSDGSTDETASLVKVIGDSRVVLINDGERKGQSPRQNEIISMTDSDILVLLNADISLRDERYLSRLMAPLLQGKADFVSGNTRAIEPRNFFEKILYVSEQWKRHMIDRWEGGNNLYTCKGTARGFSRIYYKKIIFPKSIGEDTYSYLFGITNNFRYQYVPEAIAWMKLPDTFGDHMRQSHRFRQAQKRYLNVFNESFVRQQYRIPRIQMFKSSLYFLFHHPILFVGYLCVYMVTECQSYFVQPIPNTWNIATSSKKLK